MRRSVAPDLVYRGLARSVAGTRVCAKAWRYEEAARRLGLDRRTVNARIAAKPVERLAARSTPKRLLRHDAPAPREYALGHVRDDVRAARRPGAVRREPPLR